MGVLNVTPDSFSDGGVFLQADAATRHALQMLADGADIIDIGGQSTRPPGNAYGEGAAYVSIDDELRRVLPVINFLVAEVPNVLISIDTTKAEVARRAIDSGATIINDVSAGTSDGMMFETARELNAPIILMHGYGPEFTKPKIEEYHYEDVSNEVLIWLQGRIRSAQEAGIKMILADIGFGFAKKNEDNLRLLQELAAFKTTGIPFVLGVSRKSTIGKLLGGLPPEERMIGSIAAAVYGAMKGAKIIRTHDVKETVDAMKVVDALVMGSSQKI